MFKKILNFLKKRWYVFLILFIIAGIVFWKVNAANIETAKETPHRVKREDLEETLSISGKIDATESAVLRFQTSGRLAWVGVKEGDYVKKYQTIASLDQSVLKKQLEKDLNDYLTTRWNFEQTKDDNNSALTTEMKRIIDKAQFGLNNSVLDVEIQNLSLEYASLWTPIDGLVTHIDCPLPGVNITPAQAEFDIINPNSVYFSALADQTDVVNLQNNKTGEIIFDSYPDTKVSGKIRSIAFTPKADETGTVYEVKVDLNQDNTNYRYRMGMTGDIDFVTKQKNNVLAIPTTYIKSGSGRKYVMKKVGNSKVKTYITPGEEIDDMTEIKEGLREGDIIY